LGLLSWIKSYLTVSVSRQVHHSIAMKVDVCRFIEAVVSNSLRHCPLEFPVRSSIAELAPGIVSFLFADLIASGEISHNRESPELVALAVKLLEIVAREVTEGGCSIEPHPEGIFLSVSAALLDHVANAARSSKVPAQLEVILASALCQLPVSVDNVGPNTLCSYGRNILLALRQMCSRNGSIAGTGRAVSRDTQKSIHLVLCRFAALMDICSEELLDLKGEELVNASDAIFDDRHRVCEQLFCWWYRPYFIQTQMCVSIDIETRKLWIKCRERLLPVVHP
jgi:hypothetical protein